MIYLFLKKIDYFFYDLLNHNYVLLDYFFEIIKYFGFWYIIIPFVLILITYKKRDLLNQFCKTNILAGSLVLLLKLIVNKYRPNTNLYDFHFLEFINDNKMLSFVSGDMMTALIASFFVKKIYNLSNYIYLIPLFVGLGRIYHKGHWATDIILTAFLFIIIVSFLDKKKH